MPACLRGTSACVGQGERLSLVFMTLLAIALETTALERRVALVPEAAAKLLKAHAGLEIIVESGAGTAAGFPDEAYRAVGCTVASKADFAKVKADIHVRLAAGKNYPLQADGVLVCLNPAAHGGVMLALEKLPRTSRAQALDVLSSQANLAGYAAVLLAAGRLPRLMPVLMTAAGSAKPAQVLVLGVGVAGLQAIATAKRLGAQVHAFDVRPEVAEQIVSLGAKPVVLEGTQAAGEGGYARALTPEELAKLGELLAPFVAKADVVISTAQVPGRAAPVLITEAALAGMKPASVVVDMAAGGFNAQNGIKGGNTPVSVADDAVTTENGVTVLAPTNLASVVAGDASRFYAQNMVNLLALLLKDGKPDFSDELIAAMKVQ